MISYSDKKNDIHGCAYTIANKIGFKGTIKGKAIDAIAESKTALLQLIGLRLSNGV